MYQDIQEPHLPDRKQILDSARWWASIGVTVLPLKKEGEGKKPDLGNNWQETPYVPPNAMNHYLGEKIGNIGVCCGAPRFGKVGEATLVSLDFDQKDAAEGFRERFEDLFIRTRVEISGGRGLPHLFFWVQKPPPKGLKFKNAQEQGAGEIIVHGNMVVSPSVNLANGGKYQVENDVEPLLLKSIDGIVAFLNPDRILKEKTTSEATGIAKAVLENFPTTISVFDYLQFGGQRQPENGQIRLCGHGGLICDGQVFYCFSGEEGGGPLQAAALVLFGDSSRTKGEDFYQVAEALIPGIVSQKHSAANVTAQIEWPDPDPWESEVRPVFPWPWQSFPSVMAEMGQAVSQFVNVSPAMSGSLALGAASIALRNSVCVEIKEGHEQFANLYLLVAAVPGDGKTPALRPFQKPLISWQNEKFAKYKRKDAEFEVTAIKVNAEIAGIQDRIRRHAREDKTTDPDIETTKLTELRAQLEQKPLQPLLLANDATQEALAKRMSENDEFIGVLTAEGRRVFEILMGRYSNSNSDIQLWLAGHGYDYIAVDRQGKPPYRLFQPVISAVTLIQTDLLKRMAEYPILQDSGFLPRWLYICPDSSMGNYPEEGLPSSIQDSFDQLIMGLLAIERREDAVGRSLPNKIKMSREAFSLWKQFHDDLRRKQRENAYILSQFMMEWFKKLPEHIARIALILHMARKISRETLSDVIETLDVENAINIAYCLESHTQRAEDIMHRNSRSTQIRRVWDYIEKNRRKFAEQREEDGLGALEAVKPFELAASKVSGIFRTDEAKKVLDELAIRGWVKPLEFPGKGAKRTVVYKIRPKGK